MQQNGGTSKKNPGLFQDRQKIMLIHMKFRKSKYIKKLNNQRKQEGSGWEVKGECGDVSQFMYSMWEQLIILWCILEML